MKTKEACAAAMRAYRASPGGKKVVARIAAKCRRTLHGRFMEARRHAARRNLAWGLTEQEFTNLVERAPCHYCGGTLPETGGGLDRKDNSLGYSISNVVPCCHDCNTMKGKFLTYGEMVLIWNIRRRIVDRSFTLLIGSPPAGG